MKIYKIVHWIATGLLSLLMLMSAGFYIFNNAAVSAELGKFTYPAYLSYILAIAKPLGVVAIVTKMSATLKEWAYAGFFFNFVLALIAHLVAGDGGFGGAALALVLWAVSYFTDKKIYSST